MRENINDLLAFVAVATDQSFTRAAARLGTSQSSLSRTIRKLEERLGVRLLTRTTRSVSPTEAGERLLQKIGPRLDEIEAELEALGALRDKPAGTVRINCSEYAAESVVWPKLAKVPSVPVRKPLASIAMLPPSLPALTSWLTWLALGPPLLKNLSLAVAITPFKWEWYFDVSSDFSGVTYYELVFGPLFIGVRF